MKTQDKLNEEIMKILESTPGVVGFSSLIDENNNIQNTLVGNTTIAGNKVWKDNSNTYLTRPESIIVNLYKNNGTNLVESKTVSAGLDGNWNFIFDNLPKLFNIC